MQAFSAEIWNCDLRFYLLNLEAVWNHQDLISVSTKSILRLMMNMCSSTNLVPRYIFKNQNVRGSQYFSTAEKCLFCFSPLFLLLWPVYEMPADNTGCFYFKKLWQWRLDDTVDSWNYISFSGGLIYADVRVLGIKESKNRGRSLKNSDEIVLFGSFLNALIQVSILGLKSGLFVLDFFLFFIYLCHSPLCPLCCWLGTA